MIPGRVSVLIACYQHGRWLGGALESVFRQTAPDVEAVVANDGSTDNTDAVIREWQDRRPGRVKRVETARAGQARARAAALERADGEFYITLDADDRLEPRLAEMGLAALARDPEAVVAAADVWMVDESGSRALRRLGQGALPGWPAVLEGNPLGGVAGLLMRTEAARRIGGLALDGVPGAEDWDFAVRLVRSGLRVVPVPEPLARYRQSASSFSRNPLPMLKARLELLDRCRVPDPRLPGEPGRQPLLGEADWRRLRNRQVFFILGLAAAGAPEHLAGVLAYRVPGEADAAGCAAAFAHGAGHAALAGAPVGGLEEKVEPVLQAVGEPEAVEALMAAIGRALWRTRFPGPRTWLRVLEARRATARFIREGAS